MNAIALTDITPSKTNPRRSFPKAAMDELTDSVRRLGILQPILVRPMGPSEGLPYELVAGERRYRAAVAAGLTEIPATVRSLTDAEAVEVQIVENLQRQDIDPLEEAESYAALLKCAHDNGQPYTAAEIASKIGKSKAYVYARIKLNELCEAGKKALAEDRLTVSVAELIARIPDPKDQAEAVKEVAGDNWEGPRSFTSARDHIHCNYMLSLGGAPFDVKAIYVGKGKIELPTCGACPKRAGNQPELFADVKKKDTCTDPACFEEKKTAAVMIKIEEHREAGKVVIAGAEARRILGKHEYSQPKGYVKLDDRCDEDDKGRHWRAVLGKACPEAIVVLVENVHKPGEFIEMMPTLEARAALDKKHPEIAKRRKATAAADARFDRENQVKRETKWRAYLALRESIGRGGFTNVDLRAIALDRLNDYDTELDARFAPLWGVALDKHGDFDMNAFAEALKAAKREQLLQMLFDVLVGSRSWDERFKDLLKSRDIDVKSIAREVKAELKVREKTAAKGEEEAVEA